MCCLAESLPQEDKELRKAVLRRGRRKRRDSGVARVSLTEEREEAVEKRGSKLM